MIETNPVILRLRKERDEAREALVRMTDDKNYWLDEYMRESRRTTQLQQRIDDLERRHAEQTA